MQLSSLDDRPGRDLRRHQVAWIPPLPNTVATTIRGYGVCYASTMTGNVTLVKTFGRRGERVINP
jgi:hypothetical protein